MTIRQAAPNEAAEVSRIVDAAYSKWIPVIGREPAPMLADYPALIDRGLVYVLLENDRMAGVLVIWPMADALYIDNVAVHPDYQRQRIGDMLLDFAEQKAHEANKKRLRLLTNEKMEYNQNYYRKQGFVESYRETTEDGRRIVWMQKLLL